MEYDFVVAPQHDLGRIRLRFSGADALEVHRVGDLVLRARGKELRQRGPAACQLAGKEREPVEARYDLSAPTSDFAPLSLTFSAQTVGTMSATMAIMYKNIGNAVLTIDAFGTPGDFTEANTCGGLPATLAAGASCTINVFFKPTAVRIRNGTLTVTDTASGSPHLVALKGTGQ